jgi:cutinase
MTVSAADLYNYYNSVTSGVDELEIELEYDVSQCPNERIVLAGYSQGSMVIHEALNNLLTDDPAVVSTAHISALLLLADPESLPHPEGTAFGTKSDSGEGMWTFTPGWLVSHPDIPSQLANVTGTYCDANDAVCDFQGILNTGSNWIADKNVHTNYVTSDPTGLMNFGVWGANTAG